MRRPSPPAPAAPSLRRPARHARVQRPAPPCALLGAFEPLLRRLLVAWLVLLSTLSPAQTPAAASATLATTPASPSIAAPAGAATADPAAPAIDHRASVSAPRLLNRALAVPLSSSGEAHWSQAVAVALPHAWSSYWPGPSRGVAYRFHFDASPADGPLPGVYIERACSTVVVSLNGSLVHSAGRSTAPVSRQCQQPQLVALPTALLRPSGNVLDLVVYGHAPHEVASTQRAGGLSPLRLAAMSALVPQFQTRSMLSIRWPEVLSGTLVLMGGFMFVLGWFHRKQSYLAYFGALMMAWALLLSRLWLTDLPWSNARTEAALVWLVGLVTYAGVQFLLRYAGRRLRWVDVAMPLQCAVLALSLVAAGATRLHSVAMLWFGLLSLQLSAAALFYLVQVRRRHRTQLWLMAPMLAVISAALVTEWLGARLPLDANVGLVAQLIPALAMIVLGMRLVQQYGRALQSSEASRAELEVRIREATAQIERNFSQLADLKVEQVTDRERKRIAADLHDDLGAKLLTIVHTSESERISTLAREALEEMRLSVRGLTGKPVRLIDALGDWRAEVVSRLAQSGVEAEWHAPTDEEVPKTLSARAYVQTTRIMREAVSNVIKHSGATHCSIRCTIADGDFLLRIQDNGNGIPVELDGRLDRGHGMASMKGRAKQLQGQCLVESGPGYGTVIRLTLPLDRHVTRT